MLAITLQNLSKSFPTPASPRLPLKPQDSSLKTPISSIQHSAFSIQHLNLSIPPGSLFFLLGPSGCGKTTLLRIIAGFTSPTSGRVLFGTRDMTNVPPHDRDTGMVFQSYALWPHMTVGENVAFGLNVRKIKNPDRDQRIKEALALVQMDAYIDRRPNQLSGGQQQRVALARALAIRPQCLLLDEPLSNLDAKLRLDMRSEIRRIVKAAGTTAIYVTHDQKEALSMADQIAVMNRGRLEQVGTPEELYQRPATRFVADFIGESNFIEGTVAQIFPTSLLIHTPAGPLRAALPRNTANRIFTPGTPVTLAIRPEAISISPQSPSRSSSNITPIDTRSMLNEGEPTSKLAPNDHGSMSTWMQKDSDFMSKSMQKDSDFMSNSVQNDSDFMLKSMQNDPQLPPNFLPAKRLSSTYLGETAEHLLQLPNLPTPLKALELNPQTTLPPNEVTLQILPTQVLIIDAPALESPI